jgi:Na+/phosphate symporter
MCQRVDELVDGLLFYLIIVQSDAQIGCQVQFTGQITEDALEESVDAMKKELIASHFARLAEGNCSVDVSPYYSSVILGLERVADHLVNVGYSIVNPTGSQKENN